MNEADTCRRLIVPKLQAAGWETEPYRINEQVTFTDGRIVVAGVSIPCRRCAFARFPRLPHRQHGVSEEKAKIAYHARAAD